MSITNASYYVGKRHIPNIGSDAIDLIGNDNTFQGYIDTLEREALIDALGRKEYENFISNLDVNGDLIPGADAKWDRLLNGHTYTIDGETCYWDGLKYEVGVMKESLLADYVYSRYVEDNQSSMGDVGMTSSKSENGMRVSANQRIVNAWNDFIKVRGGHRCPIDYGYLGPMNLYVDQFNHNVTLYKFLDDNKTDYPDWKFKHLYYKNSFGI